MNAVEKKHFIPGIAWFFVVLFLLCMPGNDFPKTGWLDKIFFDKWVHVGVFGLLALLFMIPFGVADLDRREKFQYFLRIAIATSIWGLATEFIQKYFTTGRSFDLLDWACDSFGALVVLLYCRRKFA